MSKNEIKRYLAKIGRKGGQISRRILTSEQAQAMARAKAARRKAKQQQGEKK